MKCTNIKELFIDVLDDDIGLSNDIKQIFEDHLNICEECKTEFAQFKKLNDRMKNIPNIESSLEFKAKFEERLNIKRLNTANNNKAYNFYKFSFKIAASILLFVFGSLFGYLISNQSKVKELQSQVAFLQQSYTTSILKEQTTSSKIKAINYFDGQHNIQPEFLSILENILNNDNNVNVRITAAKALFKYSNNNKVDAILLKSLKEQTEPLVQIELIEYLVKKNNKLVIDELRKLIENQNTNYIVKQYANDGLKVLL